MMIVMFMYGRVSKALGVKGLGHEILMKFYQFCRQYYMLIPCFFFHRFCLVVLVVGSQVIGASHIVVVIAVSLVDCWPIDWGEPRACGRCG